MSISFSTSELIDIAVGIEQRGIAFYDVMTRSTDNDTARAAFHYLVDMERQHIKIFQAMLDETNRHATTEVQDENYAGYLQALLDGAVFTDDAITSEMASQADSDIKALEIGIHAEKDSLLFYYEVKDLLPPNMKPKIDSIIAEEKSHLRQLSALKKELEA